MPIEFENEVHQQQRTSVAAKEGGEYAGFIVQPRQSFAADALLQKKVVSMTKDIPCHTRHLLLVGSIAAPRFCVLGRCWN